MNAVYLLLLLKTTPSMPDQVASKDILHPPSRRKKLLGTCIVDLSPINSGDAAQQLNHNFNAIFMISSGQVGSILVDDQMRHHRVYVSAIRTGTVPGQVNMSLTNEVTRAIHKPCSATLTDAGRRLSS